MPLVPCARCGSPVSGGLCTRCEPPSAWTIQVGAERLALSRDQLKDRLLAGTAQGTDHVIEGEAATPIAAHPAFRAWFVPGHAQALDLPEKRKRWWMFGFG